MTKHVLVIHGAGEPRLRAGKVYWQALLEQGLGRGYDVTAPRMPKPDEPRYGVWARQLERMIRELESPVVVGHSFGASVILKYFSEARARPAVAGLFLVATPFWGPELSEAMLPADFGARLRDVAPIHLYHSRDDAETPAAHIERNRQALPHAVVRVLEGRGHEFDQPTFPELVADIRRAT